MTHIKYTVTINGKNETLLYSHWSNKGYHYVNEQDTEEHVFDKPLATYAPLFSFTKNGKTYFIHSKP